MSAFLIVVIVVVVLVAFATLLLVVGSGRAQRLEDERNRADEMRREAEFHDARAERARTEAEERMARARREEAAAGEETLRAEQHEREASERFRRADDVDPGTGSDDSRRSRFLRSADQEDTDPSSHEGPAEQAPGSRDDA